jgi:CheY-like chemotaxis protein
LSILLVDMGLRVEVVSTGEQALEWLGTSLPTVVVLDIQLPGIDGWEVLSRITADPATAQVPIVVVSILDERARGMSLGAEDYIVKPVTRELLASALRRVGVLSDVLVPGAGRPPGSDGAAGVPQPGGGHRDR